MKSTLWIVGTIGIYLCLSCGCYQSANRDSESETADDSKKNTSRNAETDDEEVDTENATVDSMVSATADAGERMYEIPCPDDVLVDPLVIESKVELERLSNCTILNDVHILGPEITDLLALSNVETITGYLILENTRLTDLQGLNNLMEIGEELIIGDPGAFYRSRLPLETLDGLNNLRAIGGYLSIDSNEILTDIKALSSLESIGEDVLIRDNSSLSTCDAYALAERLDFNPTHYWRICGNKRDESCDWFVCMRGL